MKAKDIILASLLLLFPLKSSADYLAQLNLNGKEYIVEKDDSNKQIRLDCNPGDEAMELTLRAFIEEERENLENKVYGLYNSMSELSVGIYTDSRETANKTKKITKTNVPKWTFAFDNLNPKLFVLERGVKMNNTAISILERTSNIEGKTYSEYAAIYGQVINTKKQVAATADLIYDVRKATKIPFIFTHEELDDIMQDLETWDIKSLEILADEKLNELKEINKIKDKKWDEIEKTEEYKKYLGKLSKAQDRVYLYKLISDNYKVIIQPPEFSKKDSLPVTLAYNSSYGPKIAETANLEMKIEKTRINEAKCNARIWLYARNWNENNERFQDYYFLKFPKSILVFHPKDSVIDNAFEKSYDIFQKENSMAGEWKMDIREDEKFELENKIRKFLANETISFALKGWIIKTRNLAEWITWKMEGYNKSSVESKKAEILKEFEDYNVTEIPLSNEEQCTAKYLGFNISDANGKVYALISPRIEKGEVSNLLYGNLEMLVSLDEKYSGNDYLNDENSGKKYESLIKSKEFIEVAGKGIEEDEIMDFMNEKRDYYFKMNSNLKKFDIIKIDRTGKGNAEVTIEQIVDFPNPNFSSATRYEENSRMYLKKIEKEGKKMWAIDKSDIISTKEYPIIQGTGLFDLSAP